MSSVRPFLILILGAAMATAGCHRQGSGSEAIGLHVAHPPHGGTGVALGDDYSLELVRSASDGTLTAYILDDDMEEFIRTSMPQLEIDATAAGSPFSIVLTPVANPATGETVGNTSCYEGKADWIKTCPAFSGTIKEVSIRGSTFKRVAFDLAKDQAKN